MELEAELVPGGEGGGDHPEPLEGKGGGGQGGLGAAAGVEGRLAGLPGGHAVGEPAGPEPLGHLLEPAGGGQVGDGQAAVPGLALVDGGEGRGHDQLGGRPAARRGRPGRASRSSSAGSKVLVRPSAARSRPSTPRLT